MISQNPVDPINKYPDLGILNSVISGSAIIPTVFPIKLPKHLVNLIPG